MSIEEIIKACEEQDRAAAELLKQIKLIEIKLSNLRSSGVLYASPGDALLGIVARHFLEACAPDVLKNLDRHGLGPGGVIQRIKSIEPGQGRK